MQTLEGHKKFVQGVAIHPQLKLIASASSDATVRIYKNRKLKNKEEFFHKFTVKSLETAETAEKLVARAYNIVYGRSIKAERPSLREKSLG